MEMVKKGTDEKVVLAPVDKEVNFPVLSIFSVMIFVILNTVD